jgi:superfamily II DNA or RNA helicase
MKRLEDTLFEVDFLIMDEAHTMRNSETSTFKSANLITAISEHIVFLTATPVQNKLEDLFTILSLLDHDYFRDFDYFQKMIAPNLTIHKVVTLLRNNHSLEEIQSLLALYDNNKFPPFLATIFREIASLKVINTAQKVELIDKLIQADHLSFIINRTKKKDVGLALPRNAKSVSVEISPEEQEYYEAVIEFVKFLNPTTPQGFITIMPERMASSSMMASLESFRAIRKSGKLFFKEFDDLDDYGEAIALKEEANRYLDRIIIKGERIGTEDSKFIKFEAILKELQVQKIKQMIVFSFFKKTLDYLEVKLTSLGYSVGKIHGDFSTEERFEKIKKFKRGNFDILLSSEVGSEGLDMQFCNVVINYDLPWNPMRVEQRIGRIDRIGQKFDKLHIFNLSIVASIEERILMRLFSKLNIFESSIGELEPILGDLESELNIPELMNLSEEEIEQKLIQTELALERKKLEVTQHSQEFDKMLNEDMNYEAKEQQLLNSHKIKQLQEQSRTIVLKFLDENHIGYLGLKDGSLKLSSENLKAFFTLLKSKMSNKRTQPKVYKAERKILQKIHGQKELKINFKSNNSDDFKILYLYLNHPIIKMIAKERSFKTAYSVVNLKGYSQGFALIYRVDFKQLKAKSMMRVIVVDKALIKVDELDYFDFMGKCSMSKSKPSTNLVQIQKRLQPIVIESIEQHKQIESEVQNRLIDIKIDSIESYFIKQINKVKRLEQKVQQEDIVRMRIGEIGNLEARCKEKVEELMGQREIFSGFEVLGVLEIGERNV